MGRTFKLALCQTKIFLDKDESMEMAASYVNRAADNGASIVSLPEMWNCPYDNSYFREYSETESGDSVQFMSDLACENNIYLVGGSIPERDKDDNIYNTCFIFSPNGEIIGKHRKTHLFDIDVPGKVRFMESDVLTSGDHSTVIDTEFCKVGIGICYDVRFAKMFNKMADEGAKLIILPGAFNMTTGPAHWELLMRARALDNQIYFAANSPARDEESSYQAFGHSLVANPWGEIVSMAGPQPTIVYGEIDLDYLDQIRAQIPITKQKKPELY